MEPITDTSPANTFWVKYNISTGKIQSVRATEIPESEDYGVMKSDSPVLEKVVSDQLPLTEVGLMWNYDKSQWDVGERKDVIIHNLYENSIDSIEYGEDPVTSLRLLLNTEKNKATARVNMNAINKQFDIAGSEIIAKKATDELNYYITKKGDPDYYIGRIEISPSVLFRNHEQEVKLPNVQQHTEWNAVDILTRKIFNSYSYSIVNENNVNINNNTKRFLNLVEPLSLSHISMSIDKKGTINFDVSNLNNEDHYFLFRGIEKLAFVICNETPDNWLSTFSIPVDDILDKDRNVITVEGIEIPKNPIFIYKHKQVKINYEGDQR